MLQHDDDGEILLNVGDEVRSGLIRTMNKEQLLSATEGLDVDDLADLLADLHRRLCSPPLQNMDSNDRYRLESVLSFDEDSAGGLMNTDTITVRKDVTLDVVLRYFTYSPRYSRPYRPLVCGPLRTLYRHAATIDGPDAGSRRPGARCHGG